MRKLIFIFILATLIYAPPAFAATPIECGQVVTASISSLGERDTFTFSASEQDRIAIFMVSHYTSISVFAQLYDARGRLLTDSQSSSLLTAIIPEDGEYSVVFSDYTNSRTGDYGFILQKLNNPCNITELTLTSPVSAQLNAGIDIDVYRFSATADDIIRISSSGLYPTFYLYDASGRFLSYGYWGEVEFPVAASGTYYLFARVSSGAGGAYTLRAQRLGSTATAQEIAFGDVVGSLDTAGEVDVYKFNGQSGSLICASAVWENYYGLIIQIYDPTGAMVYSERSNLVTARLDKEGTYYLFVAAPGNTTGPYSLKLLQLTDTSSSIEINSGQTLSGSIEQPVQLGIYRFLGRAGDIVSIGFGKQTTTSGSFNPQMKVYNARGDVVTQVYDKFVTTIVLREDGFYYMILATKNWGTGTYRVGFLRPHNFEEAQEITFGQAVSGALDQVGSVGVYKFTADAEDKIYVNCAATGRIWGDFSVGYWLYDANFLPYWHYDENLFPVRVGQTYYILVYNNASSRIGIGDYEFTLERFNHPRHTADIEFGKTYSGVLASVSGLNIYRFAAEGNDRIEVYCAKTSETNGSFDPVLELYDVEGKFIISSPSSLLIATLTKSGIYYLVVIDKLKNGTGAYEFTLQRNLAAEPKDIAFGQTVSGELTTPGAVERYKFNASANDKLYLRFAKLTETFGSFLPYIEVRDAAYNYIANSSSGSLITTLSASGVYYLLVMNEGSHIGSGTYELSLQRVNNPVSYVDLALSQPVAGVISSVTAMKVYKFYAYGKIAIRMISTSATSGIFDPFLELYDASGNRIASSYSGNLSVILAGPGNYYLFVMDNYCNGTGSYEFIIEPVAANIVSFGETVSGTLDSVTDFDEYRCVAVAQDKIYLQLARTGQSTLYFLPMVELYDISNNKIAESGIFLWDAFEATVPFSGTFILRVSNRFHYGTGTGAYELTLQRANNPSNTLGLEASQTVYGRIDSLSDITVYQFFATADTLLRLDFQKTDVIFSDANFNPLVTLYDANGNKVASSSSGLLVAKASRDGNFYVFVTDNLANGAGGFRLSLAQSKIEATEVTFDQSITGEISSSGQIARYNFRADAHSFVNIILNTLSEVSSSFWLYCEVYDVNGRKIASSTVYPWLRSGALTVFASEEGVYEILLTSRDPASIGRFELLLQLIPAREISLGSPVSSTIDTLYEREAYVLSVDTLKRLFVDFITDSSVWRYQHPCFEIYEANGNLIVTEAYDSSILNAPVPRNLYILVKAGASDGIGDYEILIEELEEGEVPDKSSPQVTLQQPRSGEIVGQSSITTVNWKASDNVGVVWQEIRLSTDSGATYPTVIASGLGSVQSYNWQIPPDLSTTTARIKIIARDAAGNEGEDANDGDFAILSTALPANATAVDYEYDKLNRLTKSAAAGLPEVTYTYDNLGNRLSLERENLAPAVDSFTPASGTSTYNEWLTFTSVFTHPHDYRQIKKVYFLLSDSPDNLINCYYAYYDGAANKFYLRNDANAGWIGGVSPNNDYIMQTAYGQLDCADTKVSGSGNQLTITWSVVFKNPLAGNKNIYLYAEDNAGLSSGWLQKGIWQVKYRDTTPPRGRLIISDNAPYTNSTTVTLTLSATDTESGVTQMRFVNYPSGGVSWSEPEPYATTKSWTLTPGDGLKKVFVRFKDGAGNWSIVGGWDAIILDTTSPLQRPRR